MIVGIINHEYEIIQILNETLIGHPQLKALSIILITMENDIL